MSTITHYINSSIDSSDDSDDSDESDESNDSDESDESDLMDILWEKVSMHRNTLKLWENIYKTSSPVERERYDISGIIKKVKNDLELSEKELSEYTTMTRRI